MDAIFTDIFWPCVGMAIITIEILLTVPKYIINIGPKYIINILPL